MKILFITNFMPLNAHNIYSDLILELINNNHHVTVVVADDTYKKAPLLSKNGDLTVLRIGVGKYYNTNFVFKIINFFLLPITINFYINKFIKAKSYDILLTHSPPISIFSTIKFLKKKFKIMNFFLMQKDFFPQNAIDIGLLGRNSFFTYLLKNLEVKFLKIFDFIGVMSEENKNYIINNYKFIKLEKILIFPNTKKMSLDQNNYSISKSTKPLKLYYGGNLGLPQNVPLFIKLIKHFKDDSRIQFFVSGRGTHKHLIDKYSILEKPNNLFVFENLNKKEYFNLLQKVNFSLMLLDYRFSFPNYPSRILDFIDFYLPVIAAVDKSTDISKLIETNKIGIATYSNDIDNLIKTIDFLITNNDIRFSKKGFNLLKEKFDVSVSVKILENLELK